MSESKGLEIDWEQAKAAEKKVIRRWRTAQICTSRINGEWLYAVAHGGESRLSVCSDFFKEEPHAWINAAERLDAERERTHRPQEAPEWERARQRVLAKYPDAFTKFFASGSWYIEGMWERHERPLPWGPTAPEAWIDADRKLAAVPEAEPKTQTTVFMGVDYATGADQTVIWNGPKLPPATPAEAEEARDARKELDQALTRFNLDRERNGIGPVRLVEDGVGLVKDRAVPCCGYRFASGDPGPIFWNPFNNCVVCHNCGQAFMQIPDGIPAPAPPVEAAVGDDHVGVFYRRGAERLADEVDKAVQRGSINSRSAISDALLDFRKGDVGREYSGSDPALSVGDEEALKVLGARIGYGRLMQLGQQWWREFLESRGYPGGGEFAIGPYVAMMVPCAHWVKDENGHCDVCCGSGFVTKWVAELAARALSPVGGESREKVIRECAEAASLHFNYDPASDHDSGVKTACDAILALIPAPVPEEGKNASV